MHAPPLKRRFICASALAVAVFQSALVYADTTCDKESKDCVPIGQWNFSLAIGVGARSNPLIDGENIPLVLIPKLSYYRKRFFIDNLEFGWTLSESDANTFNIVAAPGYDRVFFYREDPQNFFIGGSVPATGTTPPPEPVTPPASEPSIAERILQRKREITYLAGPEWHFNYNGLVGQLDVLHELTGKNHGTEMRSALAFPLIEKAGTLTATAGFTWKSREIVTYYYGEKGIYEGGAAFDPFVKLSYTQPLSGNWSIEAFAHYEWLDSSIADSPIIATAHVTTLFAGVSYSF